MKAEFGWELLDLMRLVADEQAFLHLGEPPCQLALHERRYGSGVTGRVGAPGVDLVEQMTTPKAGLGVAQLDGRGCAHKRGQAGPGSRCLVKEMVSKAT